MKKHRIIVPAIALLLALAPATAILSQPAAPQANSAPAGHSGTGAANA